MERLPIPGLAFGLDPSRLEWRPTQVDGVGWIPLHLAGKSGPRTRAADDAPAGSTVLIRMDPGCGYPTHEHLGLEEVLCLAGGYRDEHGVVREGDYVRYEAGSAHAPVALEEGGPCILFAVAHGGIRLVEDPPAPAG
ncbi:MAG: cupin domain-containing protein [Planctomycetota bacterium]